MKMKKIIYQVLPRLWGSGKMSDWQGPVFEYLKSLSVDYIWYTGVPRHATGKSFVKGNPGSPYAISDWYDVNPYLACEQERRIEEFRSLVDRTHTAGLGVIIDFIPNHVSCDYEGDIPHFGWCDADWTDTLKNDYSDPGTVPACIEILRFWAGLGVDGFRCDMVELVPAEAMKSIIEGVRSLYPGIMFVAEVYGQDNYRKYVREVGFDLLYDKSGSYDALRAIMAGHCDAAALTHGWQQLGDLQPSMLNFLENHDEQRLASEWFASSARKGFAALAFASLFNTASFMIYFGQEVGEDASEGHEGRTSIFEWCEPDAIGALCRYVATGQGLSRERRSLLSRYRRILSLAARPVFREGANWDLCYCQDRDFDRERHFSFLRYDDKEAWLVFCNFSDDVVSLDVIVPAEVLLNCPVSVRSAARVDGSVRAGILVAPWDYCIVKL